MKRYNKIRGVNVNALTHVINQKMLTRKKNVYVMSQINRIIRFDPNFLPSSQRGRLSIAV